MNHWIVAPMVITPLVASIMLMVMRHHLSLQRIASLASITALTAIALGLVVQAANGPTQVYLLGNWPTPFGIVMVLDRLSALMVLVTALLALVVMLYAIGSGWDARGQHFHPLMQFQLMGVFGAFLTGDVFNLFVFFEVLLIASYGLMIHGGGKARLQAGVQYVVYNLLGSTLFLFALGTVYAVTGTLNMADMAQRVADLPPGDTALLRVGAALMLLVFAVKAALLPLHFWLPATYAEAPAPVAAFFAIMTKVGAYSILRVFTLIFGPGVAATAGLAEAWVMPAALLTLAVGMIGILGASGLGRLAAFAAIASMGTLLISIGLFTPQATTAALYYMLHSTLAGAALFLVVDLVRERRAGGDDRIGALPRMAQNGLVASLFFAAAIATAGMPPLSGFIGKLLVLDAARAAPQVWTIWTVILATSLIALVGFARAGSAVFWNVATPAGGTPAGRAPPRPCLPLVATCALLAGVVGLTVAAGPLTRYLEATSAQLYAPRNYIAAVMDAVPNEGAKGYPPEKFYGKTADPAEAQQ